MTLASTRGHGAFFLVLEGIDGAGTTTQTARLQARLRGMGREVLTTREPSGGPIGTMLRQFLSGRLRLPDGSRPSAETMALLFAADRLDHVDAEIAPALARGEVVISDRYDASSLAYQSITRSQLSADAALEWIRQLNRFARRPDLTIVLDVSDGEADRRRRERGGPEEMYDAQETQRRLAGFYRDLRRHMPNDAIEIVAGDASMDVVEDAIWTIVKHRLDKAGRS